MNNNFIIFSCLAVALILSNYFFLFQSGVGRYSIFLQEQFDYSGKHNEDWVLLLDTKTGTVWTYRSKGSYESKKWHKDEFGD